MDSLGILFIILHELLSTVAKNYIVMTTKLPRMEWLIPKHFKDICIIHKLVTLEVLR